MPRGTASDNTLRGKTEAKLIIMYECQVKVITPPNWCEEGFNIKKVKNTVPWIYVVKNLNEEKIVGTFFEKSIAKDKSNNV